MLPSLIDVMPAALAAVEKTNSDFSFGKPDERDFVIVILETFGVPHPPDEWLDKTANTIYEDHGEFLFTPELLVAFVYGAAVNAKLPGIEAPVEERYELDVTVDGGFPASVERSFDAVEEAIEAVAEAIRLKEDHPDAVVTLLVTKRA